MKIAVMSKIFPFVINATIHHKGATVMMYWKDKTFLYIGLFPKQKTKKRRTLL